MQLKATTIILLILPALQAAVLPLQNHPNTIDQSLLMPLAVEKFGYLELKPNGTLILSRAPNQHGNNAQNLLLLRSVLQAIKLTPNREEGQSKLNIKIYGDGVEHKFPPLLENLLQRIQTYFSIYRYTDTSRPVRRDELTTEAQTTELTTQTTENNNSNTVNDIIAIKEDDKEDAYITVGED